MPDAVESAVQRIRITIKRASASACSVLVFEVPDAIQKVLLGKLNGDVGAVRRSGAWPGLSFYPFATADGNPPTWWSELLANHQLHDDYGCAMYREDDGTYNVAWLRTVGGVGEVQLSESMPLTQATEFVSRVKGFLRAAVERSRPYSLSLTVEGEI